MKAIAHPRFNEFRKWFSRHVVDATPLEETLFRCVGPKRLAAKNIVAGIGAKLGGGRWNTIDSMAIVYASRQPETALREALEHARHFGLPLPEEMPRIIVALGVNVEYALDLTSDAIDADLPVSLDDLLAEDWRAIQARGEEATAQAVGRAAFEAGFQALVVPSKPDQDGMNVLVFPENLNPACVLEVLNPGELDKLGKRP